MYMKSIRSLIHPLKDDLCTTYFMSNVHRKEKFSKIYWIFQESQIQAIPEQRITYIISETFRK